MVTRLKIRERIRRVLVPTTKLRKELVFGDKAKTWRIDRAESLFYSKGQELAIMDLKESTAYITPLLRNPNRINLVREKNKKGLRLWCYSDNTDSLFIGYNGDFVRVPRDLIPVLRTGIRRFTRTKVVFKPPEPRPQPYEPPPEKRTDKNVSDTT